MALQLLGVPNLFKRGLFKGREEETIIAEAGIITVAGLPDLDYPEGTLILNTADNAIYVMVTSTTAGITTPTVAWWKLDESSGNATDSSANSHTGTNTNTVDFISGKYNNCADFNGTDEFFDVASHADFNQDGNFTIEFWMYMDDKANDQSILKRTTDADNFYFLDVTAAGELQYYHEAQTAVTNIFVTLDSEATGKWHHYAIVADRGANEIKIYIDGSLRTTETIDDTAFAWGADNIGIGADVGGADYLNGRLDDFKWWDKTRNPSEIQADMANPVGQQSSGWVKVGLLPT